MNSQEFLQERIMPAVRACLERYRVRLSDPVAVALSGGKDSTTLMVCLRALGHRVVALVADLGYSGFGATSVAEGARLLGFEARVISAGDPSTLADLSHADALRLRKSLHELATNDLEVPCGPCSTAKRIVLFREAARLGSRWLCYGHHREDLLSTLLKDYFATRYHQAVTEYDRVRFTEFVRSEPIEFRVLEQLASSGRASTMSVKVGPIAGVWLMRPMAFLPEDDTEAFAGVAGFPVFGSGCSHAVFDNPDRCNATKREIVHAELRRRLASSPELGERLLAVAVRTLDANGRPKANPRGKRAVLLPGFEPPEKAGR